MSGTIFGKVQQLAHKVDPVDRNVSNWAGLNFKPKAAPAVNAPPNVGVASNLAQQQDDLRNRQRGVLSNIFAGNNAPAPTVATGTVLGG